MSLNNNNNNKIANGTVNAAQDEAPSLQQVRKRMWVKEQEVNALKVQNRHLIAKLEESEAKNIPNQINTQSVAEDVQRHLRPVLAEIEKSLSAAFDMIQGTMRGIYQQSSRAQNAVDEMSAHSRDIEIRMQEQRKSDQLYYQEKIMASITAFCDRMERQIDNRLKALSVVELMNSKQNEALNDIDQIKSMMIGVQQNAEGNRSEVQRIEKESIEVNQKLIEVQIQSRNTEEISRDGLQQIQNHRAEFKLLRGEIRSMLDTLQKIDRRVNELEINAQNAPKGNLIAIEGDEIENIENALQNGTLDASKEDLTLVLDLLRSQKEDAKKIARESERFLRAQIDTNLEHSDSLASEVSVANTRGPDNSSNETNS